MPPSKVQIPSRDREGADLPRLAHGTAGRKQGFCSVFHTFDAGINFLADRAEDKNLPRIKGVSH